MVEIVDLSLAEKASEDALADMRESIEQRQSFKLEAGAGAGKTYSLIKALQFLIEREGNRLLRLNQRIACITFTNVAKDQIEAQVDRSPLIHCDTIHGFCWSIISEFQYQLRTLLPMLEPWVKRLEDESGTGTRKVEYTLGYRDITDDTISIHHDDVLTLTTKLLSYGKFSNILRYRYPIILIDEYQDTDAKWIEAIKAQYFGMKTSPLFGLFGDHWQKIYGNGCGKLAHPAVKEIGKKANFRSVSTIVDCLNRIRPELPQFVVDPAEPGEVHVYHTNGWNGQRRTGPHYGGDLPDEVVNDALSSTKRRLTEAGWDFSPSCTKILMLTHRALGRQQGYSSLPTVFSYNSSFTMKEQSHISFFVDHLEPACRSFESKRYGEMFTALGANKKYILEFADKKRWSESMQHLIELRESGTVADIIAHLRSVRLPHIPDSVERLEEKLEDFEPESGEDMPPSLKELCDLHQVSYQEIIAVTNYLEGHSPFETKHGVKGAEFENVLVILGRGWNKYNFGKMLELASVKTQMSEKDQEFFETNRNLFYVVCSRPKKRLALLFTQKLSDAALLTVQKWFGGDNIISIV